ncbi:Adrenodoxin [Gracilariopsis chorda]|uniref:Adrenodoxin n=1 Tax=Gracilariopsis chorda TaxID=448386 RepID=A0A2V3IKC7_9FLOR|nr:Adrenodoxin [Gracilariopsis chorda]|eukprot:PXF42527.1 Adrenodoxin [Gracilariopsis chorda]
MFGARPTCDPTDVLEIKARVGSTLLEAAYENNIDVDGTCSGRLVCSTCQYVLGSLEQYEKLEDLVLHSAIHREESDVDILRYKRMIEDEILSNAFAVEETSWLNCQVRVTVAMDGMEIRYPNMIEKISGSDTSIANTKNADGDSASHTAIKEENSSLSALTTLLCPCLCYRQSQRQ